MNITEEIVSVDEVEEQEEQEETNAKRSNFIEENYDTPYAKFITGSSTPSKSTTAPVRDVYVKTIKRGRAVTNY